MNVYALPDDLSQRLQSTQTPYFEFEDTDKAVEQFANELNWHIYALAPLPIVAYVDDEYIRSCLTIAMRLPDLENIDKAQFIQLFETEMSDLGYSMDERNLDAFYDYFFQNADINFK